MKIIMKNLIFLFAAFVVFGYSCTNKEEGPEYQEEAIDQEDIVAQEDTVIQKTGIIFSEDFELSTIPKIYANWDDRKNTKGMSLNSDVPKGSEGKQSIMMTYIAGENEGGHLFKKLSGSYDSLFARFYVKFLTRKSKIHHLVKLGGYYPAVGYPQGFAGLKPKGNDFFISGIETPISSNWDWGFYTYWMNMIGSPGNYWGNTFRPEVPVEMAVDEWICVEFMLKMNDPVGESNGEQAFWINGKKILHLGKNFPLIDKGGNSIESSGGTPFEGFQWRNDKKLKLNFFWLNYYMTKGNDGDIDQILFDDIIVSTEYIGPM